MEEYLERDGNPDQPGAVELLEYLKEKKIQRAIAPSADSLVITADGGYDKPETVKYWADRVYAGPVAGRNFVKLANLGDRQEVSLGAPDAVKGTRGYTLNTRIGLGLQVANKDAFRLVCISSMS